MRADDLNDGTVKALLILILIAANIALSVFAPSRSTRDSSNPAQTPQNESYVARP
jgi:hypothetical protein